MLLSTTPIIPTNDIYRYIGIKLLEDGYHDIRLVSPDIIEEKIRIYLIDKLAQEDFNLNLEELIQKLDFFTPENEKNSTMGNIVFYLLWYMSIMQSYEIIWEIKDTDKPYMEESKYDTGKISALVTTKQIDYQGTIKYVLEECKKLKEVERLKY